MIPSTRIDVKLIVTKGTGSRARRERERKGWCGEGRGGRGCWENRMPNERGQGERRGTSGREGGISMAWESELGLGCGVGRAGTLVLCEELSWREFNKLIGVRSRERCGVGVGVGEECWGVGERTRGRWGPKELGRRDGPRCRVGPIVCCVLRAIKFSLTHIFVS